MQKHNATPLIPCGKALKENDLAQRLARFDPARYGGEAMASQAMGAERW